MNRTLLARCLLISSAIGIVAFAFPGSVSGQTVFEQMHLVSPLPTANDIQSLSYGNGKFLAPALAGEVLSSDDGIAWVSHKTGYYGTISDIAYGNGMYIATSGGSGPAFMSSDLESWTEIGTHNLPPNNDNVFFHDGLFYFGGAQFGDGAITTTSDGVTFNFVQTPGVEGVQDIGFGNNLFVAVGNNLEVMTSTDGTTWTVRPTGSAVEGLGQDLLNVKYLNSLFVVGGKSGTILTSPDGIAWTDRPFSEDSSWFYTCDFEGSTYYFPGRQGTIWSTSDWATWTPVDTEGNSDVYGLVREEGITVTAGRSGTIRTSPDRTVWTNRQESFPSNFSGVAFGAGLFAASDFDGNVYTSANGEDWTQSFTPGIDIQWNTIVFEDGKFVAMSASGEWILSANGTIWSQPSDGFGNYLEIQNLLFENGKWYVGGSNGFLRSSSNLTAWTVHDIDTTVSFQDIAYGDNVFVAVGSEGGIFSSANGEDWVPRTSGTSNNLYSVEYGNERFVAVGQSGTTLVSLDGETWSAENQQNPPFSAWRLEFRDGQFIALSSYGQVYLSADGTTWTQVKLAVSELLYGTAVNDSIMVGVGSNKVILSGNLIPKKNLVVSVVGEGSVSISPDNSPYPHLSDVVVTATGTADFAFSGWSGDASGNTNPLTISMDDDKNITANFVLSVTGFALWRYTEFTQEDRADAEATSAEGDFDGDGMSNFEEYLRGLNPKVKNSDGGIRLGFVEINSMTYLTIEYSRIAGSGQSGALVQVSETLESWNSGANYTEQVSLKDNGDGTETVVVRTLKALEQADRLLMRLVFSK